MAGSVVMEDIVRAWLAELVENVDELATATQHASAPWDPALSAMMNGERQVAVFPDASSAQQSNEEWTDADELAISFHVLIWEAAGDAQSRLVADTAADFAFMATCEAARDRFFVTANRTKAGAQETRFRQMELSDGSGSIRMADITFEVRTLAAFI